MPATSTTRPARRKLWATLWTFAPLLGIAGIIAPAAWALLQAKARHEAFLAKGYGYEPFASVKLRAPAPGEAWPSVEALATSDFELVRVANLLAAEAGLGLDVSAAGRAPLARKTTALIRQKSLPETLAILLRPVGLAAKIEDRVVRVFEAPAPSSVPRELPPEIADKRVETLRFRETPLAGVFRIFFYKANIDFIYHAEKPLKVTAELKNVALDDALDAMLTANGLALAWGISPSGQYIVHVFASEANPSSFGEMPPEIAYKRIETLRFRETPLIDAMRLIASKADMNMLYQPENAPQITAELKNVGLGETLDAILSMHGLALRWRGNIGVVMKAQAPPSVREPGLDALLALAVMDKKIENLRFRDTPLQDALRLIALKADLNMLFDGGKPAFRQGVTAEMNDISLGEALGALLRRRGLAVERFGDDIFLIVEAAPSAE